MPKTPIKLHYHRWAESETQERLWKERLASGRTMHLAPDSTLIAAMGNYWHKEPKDSYQAVYDMATALAVHPEASELLDSGSGEAEQSLFWEDSGIWWRARLDWLRPDCVVDYKSARSVKPEHLEKAIWEFGYHIQERIYRGGCVELGVLPPVDDPHHRIDALLAAGAELEVLRHPGGELAAVLLE